MTRLHPADIDLIADAVVKKLRGDESSVSLSRQIELRQFVAQVVSQPRKPRRKRN